MLVIVRGKDTLSQLSSLWHNLGQMERIFFFILLTGKDVKEMTLSIQPWNYGIVQFFNSFQINILLCIFKQKPLEVTKGNMGSQRKKCTTDINKTPIMFARLHPWLFSIFDNLI